MTDTDVRNAELAVIDRAWAFRLSGPHYYEGARVALWNALEALDRARSSAPTVTPELEIRADYHDEIVRLERRIAETERRLTSLCAIAQHPTPSLSEFDHLRGQVADLFGKVKEAAKAVPYFGVPDEEAERQFEMKAISGRIAILAENQSADSKLWHEHEERIAALEAAPKGRDGIHDG